MTCLTCFEAFLYSFRYRLLGWALRVRGGVITFAVGASQLAIVRRLVWILLRRELFSACCAAYVLIFARTYVRVMLETEAVRTLPIPLSRWVHAVHSRVVYGVPWKRRALHGDENGFRRTESPESQDRSVLYSKVLLNDVVSCVQRDAVNYSSRVFCRVRHVCTDGVCSAHYLNSLRCQDFLYCRGSVTVHDEEILRRSEFEVGVCTLLFGEGCRHFEGVG